MNPIAQGISTVGSLFGIPNFGISQNIANTPFPVQPALGLPSMPSVGGIMPFAPNPSNFLPRTGGGNSVLGSSTGPSALPQTGGNTTYANPSQPQSSQSQPQSNNQPQQSNGPSLEDQIRSSINNGYGNYFNSLDQMMQGLSPERQAQEDIINNSYNQSKSDLNSQAAQNQSQLDTQERHTQENQQRETNNLNDQLGNMLRAGQVFLGANGAGDSSAANQYSYALQKLGSQQLGNLNFQTNSILNDIADRRNRINGVVTNELSRLNNEHNSNLAGVAQWFADAQNKLAQARGEGQLNQGKDVANLSSNLLNAALNQIALLQQQQMGKRNALQQWAAYNSRNLGDLANNLNGISSMTPQFPTLGQFNISPTLNNTLGTGSAPVGFGANNNNRDQYDQLINQIFG